MRRFPWLLLLALLAALGLVGCGGSGGSGTHAQAYVRATGLPPKTALAKDGSTVSAGSWGVVRAARCCSSSTYSILAVRTTSMVKGDKGALKNVRLINGAAGIKLDTAVPYFVSIDFSDLAGNKLGDPNMSVYGSNAAGDERGFATLSVSADLKKCKTPDDGSYANKYGYLQHRCILVASARTAPTTLTYVSPGGSSDVHFAIPSG